MDNVQSAFYNKYRPSTQGCLGTLESLRHSIEPRGFRGVRRLPAILDRILRVQGPEHHADELVQVIEHRDDHVLIDAAVGQAELVHALPRVPPLFPIGMVGVGTLQTLQGSQVAEGQVGLDAGDQL